MKTSKYKNLDELPLFLNVRMVADILGVSKSTVYTIVKKKGFPRISIGDRIVVPKDEFEKWVARQVEK